MSEQTQTTKREIRKTRLHNMMVGAFYGTVIVGALGGNHETQWVASMLGSWAAALWGDGA